MMNSYLLQLSSKTVTAPKIFQPNCTIETSQPLPASPDESNLGMQRLDSAGGALPYCLHHGNCRTLNNTELQVLPMGGRSLWLPKVGAELQAEFEAACAG